MTRFRVLQTLMIAMTLTSLGSPQERKRVSAESNRADQINSSTNAKVINGPVVRRLSETSVLIFWSTAVSANTVLRYGTDPSSLDHTAESPWEGFTHRIRLSNLTPDTTYYYQVGTVTASGAKAMIGIASFRTQGAK